MTDTPSPAADRPARGARAARPSPAPEPGQPTEAESAARPPVRERPAREQPPGPAAEPPPGAAAKALIEEATKKSGLVWLTLPGGASGQSVWHAWHDGAAYVVSGGIEQPVPGIESATEGLVTVRSKDKGSRLVAWKATVSAVAPGTPEWDAVVPVLHGKRLNAPDGEEAPNRWARECRVTKFTPTGELAEGPESRSSDLHAERPRDTPATTLVPQPFTVGGRKRWSRKRGRHLL